MNNDDKDGDEDEGVILCLMRSMGKQRLVVELNVKTLHSKHALVSKMMVPFHNTEILLDPRIFNKNEQRTNWYFEILDI